MLINSSVTTRSNEPYNVIYMYVKQHGIYTTVMSLFTTLCVYFHSIPEREWSILRFLDLTYIEVSLPCVYCKQ